jgi:FkbM family methyltransferase
VSEKNISMQAILKQLGEQARVLLHSWSARSTALGRLSAQLALPLGTAVTGPQGQVTFPQLGIQVPAWAAERVLRAHKRLRELQRAFPQSFALQVAGQDLHLTARDIRLLVRTWGDADVMHEILVRELYYFQLGQPCVVWDVGMNVGMASLYFAAMPQVQAVHGYELFPPTCAQARANFALNPALSAKITAHACGLGAQAQVLELPYHEELKGVVGMDGPLATHDGVTLRRERVEVIAAADALTRLRAAHPSLPVVLKMDCEGAEGEILESLAAAGLLRHLLLIIMEWHGSAMRQRLETFLAQHGFVSVSQPFPNADVGAMTVFRAN